jgi:hypothetical protein
MVSCNTSRKEEREEVLVLRRGRGADIITISVQIHYPWALIEHRNYLRIYFLAKDNWYHYYYYYYFDSSLIQSYPGTLNVARMGAPQQQNTISQQRIKASASFLLPGGATVDISQGVPEGHDFGGALSARYT